jgi:Cys-rich repeat protein
VSDAECGGGKICDTINGLCVAKLAECNTDQRCGPACDDCSKTDGRPFCLDGQVCVACRADTDCKAGSYCISGECAACATDRHCGPHCGSCGGDTPFCLSDGSAAHAACVRCRADADCVGGTCDKTAHTCSANCPSMSCGGGFFCDGARCVACYADTHCPCGGSCDLPSGTCTAACFDSGDCLPGEHCTPLDHACVQGRLEPDVQPEGGALCNCFSSVGGRPRAGGGLMAIMSMLAILTIMARKRPRR